MNDKRFWALMKKHRIDPQIPDSVGPGWVPLLDKMIKGLLAMRWDRRVAQIKEKFGGLRCYLGGRFTDDMQNLVMEYENMSCSVCEECGKPGKLGSIGERMLTRCPACMKKARRSR